MTDKKAKKLTPKQKLFVKEYPIDLNATKAAIRAGYSPKTAKQVGHENLTKPYIKELLDQDLGKRCKKLNLTAENVLEAVRAIAFGEIEEDVKVSERLNALVKLMEHLGLLKQRSTPAETDDSPAKRELAKVFARIPESGGIKFKQRHHN